MNVENSTDLILPEVEKQQSLFGFAGAFVWLTTPITSNVLPQTKNSKGITK